LPRQGELCFIKAFSNQHSNHLHKNINKDKHFSKGKNEKISLLHSNFNFLSATMQNGMGEKTF
jgi:hypothetical protein